MNKNLLCTIFAALTATISVNAQTARSTFAVPFGFQTATVSMPAGEYHIEKVNWCVLRIATADGKRAVMLQTAGATATDQSGVAKLIFNRYGAKYFLKEYRPSDSSGMALPPGRSEKEMVATAARPESTILMASRITK